MSWNFVWLHGVRSRTVKRFHAFRSTRIPFVYTYTTEVLLVVLLCPPRFGGLWSRLRLQIRQILEQLRRPWPLKRKRRCFRY